MLKKQQLPMKPSELNKRQRANSSVNESMTRPELRKPGNNFSSSRPVQPHSSQLVKPKQKLKLALKRPRLRLRHLFKKQS